MDEDSAAAEIDARRQKDRRRRRFSFVLRERRSGFDRRGREGAGRASIAYGHALLALRDRPRLLFGLLVVVNVLNLADFLLTLKVLGEGGGEANPILRSLFAMDPLYAGIFKLVAVLLTSWLAWRCRRFRSGLEAALIMLAVFTAVICYHIFGLVAYA
jgi:Domain of unknown function (DUF5658)